MPLSPTNVVCTSMTFDKTDTNYTKKKKQNEVIFNPRIYLIRVIRQKQLILPLETNAWYINSRDLHGKQKK